MRERPIVFAGGGTGGHVFPGLAVARVLRRLCPDRPIEWIGARGGLEEKLVPRDGIEILRLPLAGAARLGAVQRLRAAALAAFGTVRCAARFLSRRPAILIGVGGFASGPAGLAAVCLGIPLMLLEQNAHPGATNRALSRFARVTAATFEDEEGFLRGRVVVTGNPVRDDVAEISPRQPGKRVRHVLAFGGSRGARSLNEAWMEAVAALDDLDLHVVLQTGPADEERVRSAVESASRSAEVHAFLDDLPSRLEAADLVVCRAGATTVAELTVAGRASVLVPYPHAAGDHQRANARALANAGAAVVIDPNDLTPERLAATIRELATHPERVDEMAQAARRLARPDAAGSAAQLAVEIMGDAA